MERKRTSCAELVAPDTSTIEGLVEVEGFLLYRGADDLAWLAVDSENLDPVVNLDRPLEIFEALRIEVSAWGGGPYLYAHSAKVAGTLTSGDNGYLLSNLSTMEIADNAKLVTVSFDNA